MRFKNLILRIKSKIFADIHLLELLKGGSISFLFQIVGIGLSYLFIYLISKQFGADGMGIYSLCFALLNIFVLFGKLGFDLTAVKFIGEYFEKKKYSIIKDIYLKIVKVLIPFNVFLSILLFILSPYLAEYIFDKKYLSDYFEIISLCVLPMSLRFINANCLRGMRKILPFSFLQSISIYLFAIIILFFLILFNEEDNSLPIKALFVGIIISYFLSQILWFKYSKYFNSQKLDVVKIKDIINVSWPLLVSSSIMLVLSWADTIMLGIYKTDQAVGVYNVAYKIASVNLIVFMAFNTISAPKFSVAFGKNDLNELNQIFNKTTKLIILFSTPIFLVIIGFHKFILGSFGDEFKIGSIALIILIFSQFIKTVLGTSEYVLQMTNQQKVLTLYAFITVVLNIGLNLVLIPGFGINGAAIASLVSVLFYQLTIYLKVRWIINSSSVNNN